MEEKVSDSETMRKENRRVISWSGCDSDLPPAKPTRVPIDGDSSEMALKGSENQICPQTYIIAQNPEVLARLMLENENRSINPAAYTTPASVFNTLAVQLDDSKLTNLTHDKEVPLKTTKFPASELLKLDPIVDEQVLLARSNATAPRGYFQEHELKSDPLFITNFDKRANPSKVSILNPSDSSTYLHLHCAENQNCFTSTHYNEGPIMNQFEIIPPLLVPRPQLKNNFVVYQPQTSLYGFQKIPVIKKNKSFVSPTNSVQRIDSSKSSRPSYGSLERNHDTFMVNAVKAVRCKGGSLERNQSMFNSKTLMGEWVHRSSSLEKSLPNYAFPEVSSRSNSLERHISYRLYRNQIKNSLETEPLQEEIYDFGGGSLKFCATNTMHQNASTDILSKNLLRASSNGSACGFIGPDFVQRQDLCTSHSTDYRNSSFSPNSTYAPMAPGGISFPSSFKMNKELQRFGSPPPVGVVETDLNTFAPEYLENNSVVHETSKASIEAALSSESQCNSQKKRLSLITSNAEVNTPYNFTSNHGPSSLPECSQNNSTLCISRPLTPDLNGSVLKTSTSLTESSMAHSFPDNLIYPETKIFDPTQSTAPGNKSRLFTDRSNDEVYMATTNVVKAIMTLSQDVEKSKANNYLELVKKVGIELRTLLSSVDKLSTVFPTQAHREVEMAHKVLSKDMHELVAAMRLAQQYSDTTLDNEYRKNMLSSAHILAMDAKNLLDVVDSIRQRHGISAPCKETTGLYSTSGSEGNADTPKFAEHSGPSQNACGSSFDITEDGYQIMLSNKFQLAQYSTIDRENVEKVESQQTDNSQTMSKIEEMFIQTSNVIPETLESTKNSLEIMEHSDNSPRENFYCNTYTSAQDSI